MVILLVNFRRSVIIAKLWRPEIARRKNCWEIFAFLEKPTLTLNFSKFCSEIFHRDTNRPVVFKFRVIWPTKNQWNRALLAWQKKTFCLVLQLSLLRGSRQKSARASPQQCTQSAPCRFYPNRFKKVLYWYFIYLYHFSGTHLQIQSPRRLFALDNSNDG